MEEKAISMLQTILTRRGKGSEKKIIQSNNPKVNAYMLGDTQVLFSHKDKLTVSDIDTILSSSTRDSDSNIIIVSRSPASENVLKKIRSYMGEIQFYDIQELQIDITKHRMYMPHYIYNEKFIADHPDIAKAYEAAKIKSPEQELPRIDSQDIVVRLIGAVVGDIVYVRRHSDTAGYSHYWRQVVEDANLTE